MYDQHLSPVEFLNNVFVLMRKKVRRLIEINKKSKRKKLPLPLLKEKLELTTKILEALKIMLESLDYDKPEAREISDVYNTIAHRLAYANLDYDLEKYENVLEIIEGFLEPEDTEDNK